MKASSHRVDQSWRPRCDDCPILFELPPEERATVIAVATKIENDMASGRCRVKSYGEAAILAAQCGELDYADQVTAVIDCFARDC